MKGVIDGVRQWVRWTVLVSLGICTWFAGNVLAADERSNYVLLEASGGGDAFIETDSGDELRAGELFQISYGRRFSSEKLPEWKIDLRAGVRIAIRDIGGGDAQFVRYPLSLVFHRLVGEHWSFGGGMTYHMYPRYDFETDNIDDRIDFDDAFGQFLHAEWRNGRFTLGVRYLWISYAREDATFLLPGSDQSDDIDGNAAGAYFAIAF